MPTRLTSVAAVREAGSWLCTLVDEAGERAEVVLVPCADTVAAWVNTCPHERQRLHREDVGAVIRGGDLVCPKHGSVFDTCDGGCSNGPAAGSSLVGVDVAVNRGDVFLVDDAWAFDSEGGIETGDGVPDSTSHLRF